MGGRLEVDSTLGAVSTFSVVIPNVKIAESGADAQERQSGLASLRVVAMTAEVESQVTCADMGFNGILLKQMTPEKLTKTLVPHS